MDRRWQVLTVATAAVFMVYLDTTVVTIAFPSLQRAFPDATRAGLSWILNGYNIVFAALLVPFGRLGDAIGLRRTFMIGLAAFIALSGAAAAAPSPQVLVGLRLLQAAAGALIAPASRGLLMAEFSLAERPRAVGIWAAGGGVAAALGPPIGGALVQLDSWRLVFLVNVPLGIAAFAYSRRILTEKRVPDAQLPDLPGVLLFTAAIACLALAIVQGGDWGWTSPGIIAAIVAFVVLTPLALRRAADRPAALIDLSLFRVRSFAVANAGTLLYSMGLFAILFANVLFLTGVWHYSILTAGLALVPTAALTTMISVPASRYAMRHGQQRLIVVGALLFAGGVMYYAQRAGTRPDYLRDWLPGAVLSGTGSGLAFPALASASVAALPPPRLGVGSAVNSMVRQIGAVLGVAVIVAIIGTPAPARALQAFDHAWTFIALSGLAGGAVVLAFWRVERAQAGRPADPLPAGRTRARAS